MKQFYKFLLVSFLWSFGCALAFSQSCTHTIRLTDTWGDGWNGGAVSVSVNGATVLSNITFSSGAGPVNFNFSAASGQTIRVWRTLGGSYPSEMRVQIINNVGTILLNTVQPTTGTASSGGHVCTGSCSGGGCVGNCTNNSAYGSANAPAAPGVVTISSCTYQSEYNTLTNVAAGNQYRSTYNLGGWITVRHTSFNGTVVATGATPLTWTAPVSGTYYIHYNTNNCCGTASSCGTSTIECLSCAAVAAPANDLVCNATGISCGQTLSGTTVNATNSGTGEAGACGVNQSQPGVWYVVAGNGQNMSASLCGTAWDSKISVYSGPNCSSLSCVGGNDDNGPVCGGTSASYSWASSAGVNYYILVHGYSSTSAFNLNLTCVTPPPPAPSSISASAATICNGQNTTLTANGANGTVYWYTGGCGSTQVGTGNTLTVTPNTTTTYFARNYNNGQFSATCASTTVTVNPVPTATASAASNPICLGSTSQLNTSVTGVSSPGNLQVIIQSGGYLDETSWTLTNSVGTVIGSGGPYGVGSTNTIPIGNSANGPYTFYIETQGSFNDNTANFTVQCNGSNVLTGSLGGGQAVSQNVAACLSGAAVTYSWTPSAGLSNPNLQNPVATPTGTTTYTVTATSNGCSGSSSITVTTNPNISWANLQWPSNASVNCGGGANIYGQVYSAALTPAAGVNNTIGVQIGVSSSNTNPATWPAGAWTNANYNVQSGNNDEYVANIGSNLAQGTYYYAFRYSTGATACYVYGGTGGFWNGTSSVNGVLTVGGLDWANLQHPSSGTMCQGGSYNVYGQAYEANVTNSAGATAGMVAQLGVSSSNTNPSTWPANAWSNASFNVQSGNNDEFIGTISGLAPGTYYYTFRYKLANSCNYEYGGFNAGGGGFWNGTTNVNGSLVVNPNPTISVNAGNNPICQGNSVNLSASGASSYSWNNNAGNTASVSVTPNTTTTYVVTGTSNGCSGTGQVTVTVNTAPTLSVSASANTICSGASTTLTASGANTYAWNNGITNGVAFTPNATQTYTVTGTAANGCTGTAQTTVTVNATPSANAGPDITGANTCGKDTTFLAAVPIPAGQQGSWTIISGGNGIVSMNTPNSLFQGVFGATYVLQWNVTQNGCTGSDQMTVTFNQPNTAALGAQIGSQDLLWCGLTHTDWSTASNWYQKQPAGHYVRMSGNVQPAISSEVFMVSQANGGICIGANNPVLSMNSNAEDVFVSQGCTLNLSGNNLNIAQNLTNNGTIIASTGTVNFTGATNSTISGSGNTQLFDMTVNKSQGSTLTLQQPVLVTNTLTMTQGNVFTTNNNLLTLGTSSAAPGTLSYNTGTIVGPFKRYFTNAATNGNEGLFPVGTSTYNRYASFSFGSTPGVDQFLTVEYVTGAPMQGGSPLYNGLPCIASGALVQNYSADGYWSVVPTSNNYTAPITTAPYSVTLFANNLTGMQTPQICRIIKSAGSNNAAQHHVAWQGCGTHTAINAGVSPQAFAITSTAVQGFSWFNIGTSNNQALPVELVSFNGSCESEEVKLTWQTATEHNSSYYEVEKSRDGMEWQVLTTVTAAGNSTQMLNYETVDVHAMEGNNYYRLTQVDIDGTRKTYDAINVSCSGSTKGYFSAYPNPSTGAFQVILNDKKLIGSSVLTVRDTKGAELLNRSIEVKPGINMFNLSDLNLAPGVYYLQIVNGERTTEVLKEVIR